MSIDELDEKAREAYFEALGLQGGALLHESRGDERAAQSARDLAKLVSISGGLPPELLKQKPKNIKKNNKYW